MVYESYSRQALPSKTYRELIGSALCVFNSNTSFIIEHILKTVYERPGWHNLVNNVSGKVLVSAEKYITSFKGGLEICELYNKILKKRNRIIHSYQITKDGRQMLCSLDPKTKEQFVVTDEYLLDFIGLNEELSDRLYTLRDLIG